MSLKENFSFRDLRVDAARSEAAGRLHPPSHLALVHSQLSFAPPEPDAAAATAPAAAAAPARTGVAEDKPQETEEEQEVAHEVA